MTVTGTPSDGAVATMPRPSAVMMGDMPDDPFTGTGKGRHCAWPYHECDAETGGRILEACDDPGCRRSHSNDYCVRHYAVVLGLMLDELRDSHDMREAATPEEVRLTALRSLGAVWHSPLVGHASMDAAAVLRDDRAALDLLVREEDRANRGSLVRLGLVPGPGRAGGVHGMRMLSFLSVSEYGPDGLADWLDGIGRVCGVGFHVEGVASRRHVRYSRDRFENAKMGMVASFVRDGDAMATGHGRVFRSRDHWSVEHAAEYEEYAGFSPCLAVRRDIVDGGIVGVRAADCLYSSIQRRFRTVTDDPGRMADGVFMLVPDDEATGVMMPFTPSSRLVWSSDEDGMMTGMTVMSEPLHLGTLLPYSAVLAGGLDAGAVESVAVYEESRWRRYVDDGDKEEPVGADRLVVRAGLSYDGMMDMLAEYDRRSRMGRWDRPHRPR